MNLICHSKGVKFGIRVAAKFRCTDQEFAESFWIVLSGRLYKQNGADFFANFEQQNFNYKSITLQQNTTKNTFLQKTNKIHLYFHKTH